MLKVGLKGFDLHSTVLKSVWTKWKLSPSSRHLQSCENPCSGNIYQYTISVEPRPTAISAFPSCGKVMFDLPAVALAEAGVPLIAGTYARVI